MTLPGLGPKRTADDRVRVKALVEQILGVGVDELRILVTELQCSEPGCPPVETVVALLGDGSTTQYKIHKPTAEIDRSDLESALSGPPHTH
jgi:hypothetical protein